MEFSIEREHLLHALHLTQGIVERRTTIPILANVLLESAGNGVIVSATDQEVGVRVACKATVSGSGALTTAARKLFEIVRECPAGPLSIHSLENNWISVTAGRSRFRIVGLDPKEFPAMPSSGGDEETATIRIPVAMFREMVDRTIFSVSQDETRINLSGIYLEVPEAGSVRATATDGHRLSMITRPVEGVDASSGVILPRKGVNEIIKVIEGSDGDVEVSLQGGVAHTKHGNVELSMRLVAGDFPDYHQVVPKSSPKVMTIGIGDFLSAVRRVTVVSSDRSPGVKMIVEPGRLELSSTSPDFGEASEEIAVDYDSDKLTLGFNARYLIEVLTVLPGDSQIEMCFNDDVSPGVIRTVGDADFLYVVMPMRL